MSRFAWLPAYGCLTMLLASTSVFAAVPPVAAPSADMRFVIPSQSLASALIAFGKQANVQVLTAAQTVEGVRSNAVAGSLSPSAALTQMLQGIGITFQFVDARTVVIKPIGSASTKATGTASKTANGSTEATLLTPVQAIAMIGKDTSYMGDVSSGPTRTLADPLDVSQSVGIVTQGLFQSQQLKTVQEAVQNVAGAVYYDDGNGLPIFLIRGFQTGNGMTDGLPNSISGIGEYPPLIGVERVEVLKGPQAILGDDESGGNNDFGGLINIVLKKPQSDPVHVLTFSVGQYGEKQVGLDLAGALNNSKSLSYRLIVDGDVSDRTEQGMNGQRERYIAPSIGWTTTDTYFVAGFSWLLDRIPIPDHVVLRGDSVSEASPPGILLDNPGDHTEVNTRRFYYLFEHRFNDVWTFRSRAQYVRESENEQFWQLTSIQPDGDTTATAVNSWYSDAYYALQNDLVASWGHGWLQHTVTLGFDYSRVQVGGDTYGYSNGEPYNLFTGGGLPPPASALTPADYTQGFQSGLPWVTQSGVFIQDQMSLGTQWELLVAWRRAAYELQTTHLNGTPWNEDKVQWVPNFGLVYKLEPNISLYASTSNGFEPDTNLGKNGRPLPVVLSRQIELGSKFDLFDNRARLTLAAYRIMLDHSYDLVTFGPYYVVPGPGQTDKGVEAEFNGQVTKGFEVSASFTNALVENHDGSPATGSPRQVFNLWGSYMFQDAPLRGWGVAAGVLAHGPSLGETYDFANYIHIPGQASVAANVSYRTQRWSVTFGVKNLLDRNLYGTYFSDIFVPLNNRRTYLLSGAISF
jgi:iron complex outermembrane recepter protein